MSFESAWSAGVSGPVLLLVGIVVVLVVAWIVLRVANAIVYIDNNQVGIVEKRWSPVGSVTSGLIALKGEAGFQPDPLRGGFHFFMPFVYTIHRQPLVSVQRIAYVYARDGVTLDPTQTLAANARANDFHDVRGFLAAGGQKGMQRKVLRDGTHAINLAQFVVFCADGWRGLRIGRDEQALFDELHQRLQERNGFDPVEIKDGSDQIGIVTIHDGAPLAAGEIIAPEIDKHSNFQDADAFVANGGKRGRQLQVLVEGTYYLNRLFATVEFIAKTEIPVGHVGVVVSYTGAQTGDVSGAEYRHGELVEKGSRGVWMEPMLPGKYAFNSFAGKVLPVPTTNFLLKWVQGESGGHQLDSGLSEISLVTKDAFEPALPLSVVVHIDYKMAPYVIQRFGDLNKLVEQTLDPMVSSYFKNIGQTKSLIELLQQRTKIQQEATEAMQAAFANYSLQLQEVMIGTPRATERDNSIERLLDQLRQREIAKENIETFKGQKLAADAERELNEAKAIAAKQQDLIQSKIAIEIAANAGAASVATATKDAEKTRISAEAERNRVTLEGEGQAASILAIGNAKAAAIKAQAEAYGRPELRLAETVATAFAQAAEKGKLQLVPNVSVTTSGDSGAGLLQAVLGSFADSGAFGGLAKSSSDNLKRDGAA